jgi:carbon monoxide dehydrogenase subunit G
MEFSGSQTIAAPIEKVWAYLLDVNKVAACAPGFQSLEVLGDEHWKAVVSVGVGPVKGQVHVGCSASRDCKLQNSDGGICIIIWWMSCFTISSKAAGY